MSKPFRLSVKAIVRNEENECLVIRRSNYSKHNAGRWDFPGGKVDVGENFDAALIREIGEETSIEIKLTGFAGCGQSQAPENTVIYLFMNAMALTQEVVLSEEHTEYQWVPLSNLLNVDMGDQFKDICEVLAAE